MTGRFVLRNKEKPNEKGECCIYLHYSTMSVPVKKSMNIWISPDYWLGDDGRTDKFIMTGRTGHPKGDLLNRRLANTRREYDKIVNSLMTDPNCVMTVPMLRSILNGTYKKELENQGGKVSFVDYVLDHNKELYDRGKISFSVWENIKCNMRNFTKYLRQVRKTETLYCRDIKVEHIKEYIIWRKERGNTNDTINKCLTPIFKAINKIMRLGWINRETGDEILELYLPSNVKSIGSTDDDTHYLTEEQVRQLINLTKKSKYPRTMEMVDMFLFSIHCGGMRFSDVCTLRWSEVDREKRMIKHLQVKNHTRRPVFLTLPISSECMKILDRWVGRNENFVFGLLGDEVDLNDIETLKHTINSRNRTMNQSLKCIGEKMGLPFNLHFHVARHTFATLSLNRGVELNKISHLMGHSSTMVTEKVYASFLPETLSEVVNEKLDFHFD